MRIELVCILLYYCSVQFLIFLQFARPTTKDVHHLQLAGSK